MSRAGRRGGWALDGFDRKGQQREGILVIISVLDLLVAGRARPRLPRAGLLLLRRLRRHLPRRLTEATQGAKRASREIQLPLNILIRSIFRNEARQEAGDRVPEAGPAQGVSEATAAAAAAGDDAEAAQDPPRPQGGFALLDYDPLSYPFHPYHCPCHFANQTRPLGERPLNPSNPSSFPMP